MVNVKAVLCFLNELAPFEIKENWDNIGLMVGDENAEVSGIAVALDCTLNIIEEAINKGANLIVTHHPLIFGGINSINFNNLMGQKIKKLIENKINVISVHTNLDKATGGINDFLCEILELQNVKNLTEEEFSLGRTGELKSPVTLKEFVLLTKEKLNSDCIKYIGDENRKISKVAVVSGSGSEFYTDAIKADADVFLTSEVKHHIATEIADSGFAIIDAGHFETENIITNKLKDLIEEKFRIKAFTIEGTGKFSKV